jgi:predicted glycosyl hydrolase (DUF1957 family)
MKHHINVNRQILSRNNKTGRDDPAISVRNYKENIYGHWFKVGPVEIIQAGPTTGIKPLACGARVFIRFSDQYVEKVI